ncbi:DUF2786 domain-containing protein [Pseudomonas vranovensis]|uniref:DUF2786 domain-containing protein n=1 Tax=Pseudomonas vranovensis TaxID=321661 RepID=UPI003D972ECA
MSLDQQERERIIRKIKHCLALSASSNEHEAAAAMRQAQKLMRKYRLTELDVHISSVGKTYGAQVKCRRPAWDRDLINVVAEAFNCKGFTHSNWDADSGARRERALFVGVSPAQEIAKYAYDILLLKASAARKAHVAKIKRGEIPQARFTPETRGNHFAEAWVSEVRYKLQELVPEADESDELGISDEKALTIAESKEHALISAFVHQLTKGKGPTTERERKMPDANIEDLVLGMKAGRNVELNHGLANAGDTPTPLTFDTREVA